MISFSGMSWHIISMERIVQEKGKYLNQTEVFIQLIEGPNKSGETKQGWLKTGHDRLCRKL